MKQASLFVFVASLIFTSCVEDPISIPSKSHISILQPANNASVSDSISIIIDIASLKEIIRVEIFIDHQLEKVFTKPPYVFFWYVFYYYEDGSQHIIEAKSYDKDGDVMTAKPVIVNIYRFMPSYLQAFMNSDSIISLKWNDNSKIETGFEIEHANNDTIFTQIGEVDSNITDFVFKGVFNKSEKHYFRVRAKSQNAVSGYSNIALAQIVLQKPTNVNINFTSDTTATIQWQDNCSFEIGYYVEVRRNNLVLFWMNYPANTTRADIQCDFQNGYYYQCIVTTRDTFQQVPSDPAYKQFYFYAPDSLSVEQISESKARIKWKNANFFSTKYRIERKINDGDYSEIGTTNPAQLYFENDNLDTANTYYYRVSAFTRVNTSSPTNPIKVGFLPYITFDKYLRAPSEVASFEISKDGNSIIMGGYGHPGTVCFWIDAYTASLIKTFFSPDSDGIFDYVGISHDNSVVAAGSSNNKYVKLWNTSDGSLRSRIYLGNACYSLLFHPNRPILVFASYYKVVVFDYGTSTQMYTYSIPGEMPSISINGTMNALAIGGLSTNTKIIDLNTGLVLREFASLNRYAEILFSLDDNYLLECYNNTLRVWDILSSTHLDHNISYFYLGGMAFHPKKNHLLFCGTLIYDFSKREMISQNSLTNQGSCLKFFTKGDQLASNSGTSYNLRIWKYNFKWQINPF